MSSPLLFARLTILSLCLSLSVLESIRTCTHSSASKPFMKPAHLYHTRTHTHTSTHVRPPQPYACAHQHARKPTKPHPGNPYGHTGMGGAFLDIDSLPVSDPADATEMDRYISETGLVWRIHAPLPPPRPVPPLSPHACGCAYAHAYVLIAWQTLKPHCPHCAFKVDVYPSHAQSHPPRAYYMHHASFL